MSEHQEKVGFLWDVHRYTNEYIRFADTKAAFIAGVDAALIGTAISSSLFDSCLHQSPCHWSVALWLGIAGVIPLCFSIAFSVSTIIPLRWHNVTHGFIYWNSVVAHGSPKNFGHAFVALSSDGMTSELTNHIYVLGTIAKKKYEFICMAAWLSVVGCVLTGIAVWLQHALK
jgi:hypothetical protein